MKDSVGRRLKQSCGERTPGVYARWRCPRFPELRDCDRISRFIFCTARRAQRLRLASCDGLAIPGTVLATVPSDDLRPETPSPSSTSRRPRRVLLEHDVKALQEPRHPPDPTLQDLSAFWRPIAILPATQQFLACERPAMTTPVDTSGGSNIEPLNPNKSNTSAAAPATSPAIVALAVLLSVALIALAVVFVVRRRLRSTRRNARFDALMELQPPLPPPPPPPPRPPLSHAGAGMAPAMGGFAPGVVPTAAHEAMADVGMRPAAAAALGPYPRGVWGPGSADAARQQGRVWDAARPGNAREALRCGRPAPALRRRRDTFPTGSAAAAAAAGRVRGRRGDRAGDEADGPATSEEMYDSDEELVRGRRERGVGEGLGRRRRRGDDSDGKFVRSMGEGRRAVSMS